MFHEKDYLEGQGNEINENENLGEYARNIGKLMVALMWVIVNPGPLGILDLDSAQIFASGMVWVYHIIAIFILLNLTITLMNSTIQRFQNSQLLYWKCEITSALIEYFDCPSELYLPVPFSAILAFWKVICLPIVKFWRFCFQSGESRDSSTKSDHLTPNQVEDRRKHAKLMQELIMRLMKKNKVSRRKKKCRCK